LGGRVGGRGVELTPTLRNPAKCCFPPSPLGLSLSLSLSALFLTPSLGLSFYKCVYFSLLYTMP
jgi:hypothetical protein